MANNCRARKISTLSSRNLYPSNKSLFYLVLSQLFCCSDYREFVETVLEMQKQENERIDSKQIDIQPHGKVRSRRARQLAEERAKTRLVLQTKSILMLF